MYRILALLLLLSIVLIGCAAEPTPTATPEPTIEVPTEAPTNTEVPTATPVPPTIAPTNTPAPTATPQPITGSVKSTLNVREQPSIRAALMGVLKTGDVVNLVGRTEDSSWLQINYPLGETTTAWVIAERINTTSNLASLPSLAAATTPAATKVAVGTTTTATITATVAAGTPVATTIAAGTVTATAQVTTTTAATETAATAVPGETPAAPSTGGTPPGSILFDTFENGTYNIYKVRADGTGLQQLIAGGSEPALSPNGSNIAYRMRKDTGGLGIGVASATGAYEYTLTEESAAGYPSWAPDGNNVTYHILPSNRLSGLIMRIPASAGNTPADVGVGVRPAWQPNAGGLILFDGCKGGGDCGSLLTQSAFEPVPDNPKLIRFGIAGAWSPNSTQIAFQAPDDKGSTQIWVAKADGSDARQVTTDVGTHGMPTWSSDGQWLFYRTDQGGTGWAIYAIRTNGADAHKIVDSNVNAEQWTYAKLAIAP